MKIKNKKVIIGTLGTMAMVSLPLATVISCGTNPAWDDKWEDKNSRFLEEFAATINRKTFEKDGWGQKKHFLKLIKDYNKGTISVLSDEFVDYLVKKVNEVDLTKDHKIFYMNLRGLGMDKLGDYFTQEMSKIKIETKEYELSARAYEEKEIIKGTSGILLNIGDNPFTADLHDKDDWKKRAEINEVEYLADQLMKQTKTIRGVIYSEWSWGFRDSDREHWLKWVKSRVSVDYVANRAIRYKSK
ncbi:hypothetical protein [Mycoplasma todarodis]|uniref:hypothetical protein n=1 Tax=Mycoplasma todarodis TaxID=1937191 RepID=UPI003B325E2A